MRTLYDEQASPLYTYVVRLLGGDRHRAEDVVQETLLRCWRTQDVGAASLCGGGCSGWPATSSSTSTGRAGPVPRRSTAPPG
ncbi:sigma factor [Streptomyces sp. NPDC058676]